LDISFIQGLLHFGIKRDKAKTIKALRIPVSDSLEVKSSPCDTKSSGLISAVGFALLNSPHRVLHGSHHPGTSSLYLSPSSKFVVESLQRLEVKYSESKLLDSSSREQHLRIMEEISPLIEDADNKFHVLVLDGKVLFAGFSLANRFKASDDFQKLIPEFETESSSASSKYISMIRNQPPWVLDLGEGSSVPPPSITMLDLLSFAVNKDMDISQVVHFDGSTYTLEANSDTRKADLESFMKDHIKKTAVGGSGISNHLVLGDSSTHSQRVLGQDPSQVLQDYINWENLIPELAKKFNFTYHQTSLGRLANLM
jgi:hypothetical protein